MIALLLEEFVTTAIPDNSFIRELLSTRPGQVTRQDIARFRFCLQIVYYLLACMALKKSFADPTVGGSLVDDLHSHLQAYYSSDHVRVKFADYIVLPIERDQFLSALRGQIETKDAAIDVDELTTTRLTLFDLVAVKRLGEYSHAMRHTEHRFQSIAELMLTSHFGASDMHLVPKSILAKIFSDSYELAAKIIARVKDSVPTELESTPIKLAPNFPDVTTKTPYKIFSDGEYTLVVVQDVEPYGGGDFIKFKYVIAVTRHKLPVCFVTLESSPMASDVLCVFENDGSHSNYGTLSGTNLLGEFLAKGESLIKERFSIGTLKELGAETPSRPWWTILSDWLKRYCL